MFAQASAPQLRPLGIGEILDVGLKIYFRNWLTLFKIVVFIVLPAEILANVIEISALPSGTTVDSGGTFGGPFGGSVTTEGTISRHDAITFLVGYVIAILINFVAARFAQAGCFRAVAPGTLQALLEQVDAARSHVKAIDAALAANPGASAADFGGLDRVLYQAGALVRAHLEQHPLGAAPASEGDPVEGEVVAPADTAPPISGAREVVVAPGRSGTIRGREDVVRALDRICEYYAQYEPSSPLPLILQRCRRLVSSSFLEIVRDLAPDALAQVQAITGKTED